MAAGCVLSRGQIINGFHSLNRPDNPAIDLLETMPGEKDTLFLNGGSCIILPDSEYLAQPLFDKEGIIYGDIDPRLITEGHLTLDTNGHYSRPDVFRLEINDQPQVNTVWKSDTE